MMTERQSLPSPAAIESSMPALGVWASAFEYAIDTAQRSILFWDVMRQLAISIANI
jgi:hypothetical protein